MKVKLLSFKKTQSFFFLFLFHLSTFLFSFLLQIERGCLDTCMCRGSVSID